MAEEIRKKIVGGMRVGKMVVLVCGKEFPDFEALRLGEEFGITWQDIFNWKEFRKPENHMKLLKEKENYNMSMAQGRFEM